ncbi:MAG TPA: prepilin-type N-terminal cleavage/methylation domain-containing protein [Ilumatobacteraceae bacterium]
MSHPARRRDDGFALPEILISIVVMSVIASVMVGVVAVVLRTTPTTEARGDDARTLQGLVTWLPQDVDSTPTGNFDLNAGTPSGCSVNPGTNLLRLQWQERAGSSTVTYIANYRHVQVGATARIQRVTCSGVGAQPYTTGFAQNMTSELPSSPSAVNVTIKNDVDGNVELVTFQITTLDGKVVQTDSAPKNPDQTLPTTIPPSWKPPTPTTGVAVNNAPLTTNLAFTAHPGLPVVANLVVSDPDNDVLTVELKTVPTGWIVLLVNTKMTITPLIGALPGSTGVIEYTVKDNGNPQLSVVGNVTVSIVSLATPTTTSTTSTTTTTTTTTTTVPTCAVMSRTISPTSARNVNPDNNGNGGGQVDVGVLKDPVTITAETNGHCTGVDVRYDTGAPNSAAFVNMTQVGPTSYRVVLNGKQEGSSELWADGTHVIYFYSAQGGSWGSINLTVA